MTQQPEVCAVPLHEQLASVPDKARLVIDDPDGMGTSFIPVGRMCNEAAAELRRLHQSEREGWRYAKELESHITTLEAALQQAREALSEIAALKRRDPCKNRSNAGKWVAWTAPAELAAKIDAAKQALGDSSK